MISRLGTSLPPADVSQLYRHHQNTDFTCMYVASTRSQQQCCLQRSPSQVLIALDAASVRCSGEIMFHTMVCRWPILLKLVYKDFEEIRKKYIIYCYRQVSMCALCLFKFSARDLCGLTPVRSREAPLKLHTFARYYCEQDGMKNPMLLNNDVTGIK